MTEPTSTEPAAPAGDCPACRRYNPPTGHSICGGCRDWIAAMLGELLELWTLVPDELWTGTGRLRIEALDLLTPVPSSAEHRRAGGVTDTTLPAIATEVTPILGSDGRVIGRIWHRRLLRDTDGQALTVPAGDQHGAIPLIRWLDTWVQAWQDLELGHLHRLPTPTVGRLVGRLGARLDWACTTDGTAVDDLAAELAEQVALLRRVTHMQPKHLAAECPSCDRRSLWRWPNARYVECCRRSCGRILKPGEYDQYLTAQVNRETAEATAS